MSYDQELMRLDSFNYAIFESDKSGITHFETRFAVKGNILSIQLSMIPNPRKGDSYLLIQFDGIYSFVGTCELKEDNLDQQTCSSINRPPIPNVLLDDAYTALYINIKNQTLEIGKECSTTPLIQTTDDRFRKVQYIGFTSWNGHKSSYLYDCPRQVEETL